MKKNICITGIAFVMVVGMSCANANLANVRQDAHAHEHNHKRLEEQKLNKQPVINKVIEDDHIGVVTLSQEQTSLAGIQVERLSPKQYVDSVYAPGEVKANGYTSYLVSPRTDSVVISRHASLGDHVSSGQPLVTLFSEAVAEAQAEYLIASSNWRRAKKLGRETVSESTLVENENTYKATRGKLIAFGLTAKAIDRIAVQGNATFGQYSLTAKRAGVVLEDDFMQGQRVAAGESIMLLADESELWVEANVPPNKSLNLKVNSPATIELDGKEYQAKVIQEAHTIDPVTRTRVVRLVVQNDDHRLHSGMFVRVFFPSKASKAVMAVPEEALMRNPDGDWTIFVASDSGTFKAVEVTRGEAYGDFREIIGINAGTFVVKTGAFFIASELAKSGFDPHNH